MSITVSQVLQLEGLKNIRILAGSENLWNEIEKVNILEAVQDSQWDKDWEGYHHQLVLTTFNVAKDDLAKQKSIIGSLQRGECSVLVFQPTIIPSLSEEVIEYADSLGFPLIEIPAEMEYPLVIMPITEAILKEKTTLLQRSKDIHRKFMDLVLDGDEKNTIAFGLCDLIHRPVAIFDPTGNELASSYTKIEPEKLSKVPSFLNYLSENLIKEITYDEKIGLLFMPLLSGRQSKTLGYIFVDARMDKLDQLDFIAIEQAAVVATYDQARRIAVQEVERHLRRDFIEELLEGDLQPKEKFVSQARILGWDLTNKPTVIVIENKKINQDDQARKLLIEDRLGGVKETLFKVISQVLFRNNPLHIFIDRGDSFLLLPHFEPKTDKNIVRKKINDIAMEIIRVVKEKQKEFEILIAIGGIHGTVDHLRTSYSEARSALRIGPRLLPGQKIFWYEELAAYTLFEKEEIGTEANQLVEHFLGRLIEYDRNNHTNLVETMEVYFDNNQILSTSAARLYIHPKTMKYRLNRIKEIIGTDPFSGHIQFHYYFCTKAAKLNLKNENSSENPYSDNG
jgi:purine catabolism regulator